MSAIMLRMRFVLFVLLAAMAGGAAASQIYRCAHAGSVSYQEQPCSGASRESAWSVPEFPPVNIAERERLLQREAALEARLLKRAEIEAAERIARDNRRARELELAAERERAKPVEPLYLIPVIAQPRRPPRPHRHGALFPRY